MVIVHTPTPNLDQSVTFYTKLGYQQISQTNPCLVGDSQCFIEINPDRYARPGVKIYRNSWSREIETLRQHTEVYEISDGYLVNDTSGCWIYLIEGKLDLAQSSNDTKPALPGSFNGVSLETANFKASLSIWQNLGFKHIEGDISKGIAILSYKDQFTVTLMKPFKCPHLFFNPSLTYFNGSDNLKVIEEIRMTNITIAEEITHFNPEGMVDNIIIKDPGGYGFFIFND
jgi:hypothetical protein